MEEVIVMEPTGNRKSSMPWNRRRARRVPDAGSKGLAELCTKMQSWHRPFKDTHRYSHGVFHNDLVRVDDNFPALLKFNKLHC